MSLAGLIHGAAPGSVRLAADTWQILGVGDHSTSTPVSGPSGGASSTAPRSHRWQAWWPWMRRLEAAAEATATCTSLAEAVSTHTSKG